MSSKVSSRSDIICNSHCCNFTILYPAPFPGFIFHDNLDPEIQFLILGLIFWLQANMIFIGVSIFSNKINNMISDDNFLIRVSYVIEICVYIFIAIWILK